MGTALHATCLGAERPPCDAYRFMPIFRSVGDPWNFTLSLPAISRFSARAVSCHRVRPRPGTRDSPRARGPAPDGLFARSALDILTKTDLLCQRPSP